MANPLVNVPGPVDDAPVPTTLDFDEGLARQVEAVYATPDVAATRISVFRAMAVRAGQHVLDVGCGPGYLARDLALAVGERGRVTGVDVSEPMLALAAGRGAGLDQLHLQPGDAEHLPVADHSVDAACAVQVLCYVRELGAALAELRRALVPGGRLVVLDSDFGGLVWQAGDRQRMDAVMDAYDAHVAWPDLPRVLPGHLRDAGFEDVACEVVPIVTLHSHPHTFIHGLARFIHTFVTTRGAIPVDVADAWLADLDALESRGGSFFALNRFLFVARSPS
jgi:arsenite methyltransferase